MTKQTINKKKNLKSKLEASDGTAEFEVQIQEILNKLAQLKYEWLLITQQYDFPWESIIHNTRDDLIYDLGSAITCHCSIVEIYHQGNRLSEAEIELLEKEALGGLGPISRARAEGKI